MSPLQRFAVAMPAAAAAGGLASFLGTFIYITLIGKEIERALREALRAASFVGFWACIVALAYTLVLGLAVYAYVRRSDRRPPLSVALVVGVLGAVPFILPMLKETMTHEALFIPVLAVLAALVTAWTFWRIALKA